MEAYIKSSVSDFGDKGCGSAAVFMDVHGHLICSVEALQELLISASTDNTMYRHTMYTFNGSQR